MLPALICDRVWLRVLSRGHGKSVVSALVLSAPSCSEQLAAVHHLLGVNELQNGRYRLLVQVFRLGRL